MAKSIKIIIYFSLTIIVLIAFFCGIFFLSFKLKYKDIVFAESQQYDIEPSLILSIIKAESKFNPKAKSSANAIGLMQIKLETANYILFLDGESQITETDLYIPQTNIKLGTKYFLYLLNKFENVDVSICAYNAGETVVRSWLQNNDYSNDGKTLSKIPYPETENYLQKVKFNQKIYKIMLKR